VSSDEGTYRVVSRRYEKRFPYLYQRHVFDKLRQLDITVGEFQQVVGAGEVIAELEVGLLAVKELVLVVEWIRPLHVVIVVDEAHREERLVAVYEPDPMIWTGDFRRRR
jgi:hypothetical protein